MKLTNIFAGLLLLVMIITLAAAECRSPGLMAISIFYADDPQERIIDQSFNFTLFNNRTKETGYYSNAEFNAYQKGYAIVGFYVLREHCFRTGDVLIFQEASGLQTEIIYVTADIQTHFFNITLNVSKKDINNCMDYDIDNNNTINFVELKYYYKCYIGINKDPGCPENILQNKTVMDLIKICFDIDNPEFINHPSTVTILSEPVFNIYPEQEQEQEQIQNSNSKTLYAAESEPQPNKQPETHQNTNKV